MNTKARITYRFDKDHGALQQRQPLPTETPPPTVVPFFQEEISFTQPQAEWKSPFQDDASALEQLIRDADKPAPKRAIHRPSMKTEAYDAESSPLHPSAYSNESDLPLELHDQLDAGSMTIELGDEQDEQDEHLVEAIPDKTDDKLPAASNVIEVPDGPFIDPRLLLEDEKRRSAFTATRATVYRSNQGPSWLKVFASVAGAIATGALFGYMALSLFTGGEPAAPAEAPSQTQQTGQSSLGDAAADQQANTPSTSKAGSGSTAGNASGGIAGETAKTGKLTALEVPSATYMMLQFGVFSGKEGMEAAVSELKGKGLAAAAVATGKDYRVYAGMSGDRGQAEALQAVLPDLQLYVKPIEVPALTQLPFKGKAEAAQTFFALQTDLLEQLDRYASGKLEGAEADGGAWRVSYEKWAKAVPGIEASLTDQMGQTAMKELKKALSQAASAASNYDSRQDEKQLWAVQSSLMDAVFILQAWFASTNAL
ncbi:SPOR domain-containing protein [Paenibacillus methanolicus]|uniref:Sporulation related protein n=1 Tax=Paenibacillus methanolicus TaxID=582686 RepID=A0A5S5C3Z2_9BACL|nr:SPOR domain-containing protein [Paenibacillus methanolicus]TYP73859.1 sporulation related protein [Paenibacillus methanolicus]